MSLFSLLALSLFNGQIASAAEPENKSAAEAAPAAKKQRDDSQKVKAGVSLMLPIPGVFLLNLPFGADVYLKMNSTMGMYAEVGNLGVWYGGSTLYSLGTMVNALTWFQMRFGISYVNASVNRTKEVTETPPDDGVHHYRTDIGPVSTTVRTLGVDFGPRVSGIFWSRMVLGVEIFRMHVPLRTYTKEKLEFANCIRAGGGFIGVEF